MEGLTAREKVNLKCGNKTLPMDYPYRWVDYIIAGNGEDGEDNYTLVADGRKFHFYTTYETVQDLISCGIEVRHD